MEEKAIYRIDQLDKFSPARMPTKDEDCQSQANKESTNNKSIVGARKQTALDVANMIGPSSKDLARREATGYGGKPLDLSHRGLTTSSAAAAYKAFYPYPTLPVPTSTLSPYSYLGETASSALTPVPGYSSAAAYGAAYPLYGTYPVASADSTVPSLSTLRLSAMLASRKRRVGVSCSDKPDGPSSIPESSRKKVRPVPEEKKDNSYWDRRRKNNDAAKRSRDARREKEEEIALRAVFLEQENMKLRAEVSILKGEMGRLHYMAYNC